jgi:hypothetical protein
MPATTTPTFRTKFTATDDHLCSLLYEDAATGDFVTRHFFAPADGGYVREWVNGGRDARQVCDALGAGGATLYWSGRKPLIEMIRREFRLMRRRERAEF